MNGKEQKQINEILENRIQDLSGINFIRYLGVEEGKKCAVVCQYMDDADPNQYYGLLPQISPDVLLDHVLSGELANEEELLSFVRKNDDWFSLHPAQEIYEEALFAMVLLRMASRFGIMIRCDAGLWGYFIECVGRKPELFIKDVTYKIMDNGKDTSIFEIALLGGITTEMAQYLDLCELAFHQNSKTKQIFIVRNDQPNSNRCVQLYQMLHGTASTDAFHLCFGDVYYSGVLPRVLELQKIDSYSNPHVQTIKLTVERTTYATCDAFNYGEIILHPLLHMYEPIITQFMALEDDVQQILFREYADGDDLLQGINQYLSLSQNTNTLAVSGNIMTEDCALIVAKREKGEIDGGTHYCSINGQSEFQDHNVKFYQTCVDEDYPTMQADSNSRNNFSEELDRETMAELNIDKLKRNWQYYGIAIMGIHNQKFQTTSVRRMQFNILAHNSTYENFDSVIDLQNDATEKFENEKIEGLKIHIFKGRWDVLRFYMKSALEFFRKHETIFNHGLAFAFVIIVGLRDGFTNDGDIEMVRLVFVSALAVFLLLNGFLNFRTQRLRYKVVKPFLHKQGYQFSKKYTRMKNAEICSATTMNKLSCHPIAQLMLLLHLYQSMGSTADKGQ